MEIIMAGAFIDCQDKERVRFKCKRKDEENVLFDFNQSVIIEEM